MRIIILFLSITLAGQLLTAQTFRWNTPQQQKPAASSNDPMIDETGFALFYADYFEGNPTALGEVYRGNQMTAAHPKLPLGTIVKVTRLDNGLSTTVRINDRGAYCDECIIDLSRAAAQEIGLLRVGRSKVNLTVMGFSNSNPPTPASYQAPNSQLTARTPAANNTYAPAEQPQNYQTARSIESTTTVAYRRNNEFGHDQIIETYQVTERPTGFDNTGNAAQLENRHNKRPAVNTLGTTTTTAKGATTSTGSVNILTNALGAYAVQLGSYGEFANAERHVLALQQKGFNSVYVMKQQRAGGGTINRVLVTPFATAAEAQQYLGDLRQYHQMEGLVVTVK